MEKYIFVADSGLEIDDKIISEGDLKIIHFDIFNGGILYKIEGDFNRKDLIKKMRESKEGTKTACPSPEDFKKAYGDEGNVFIITISSKLSGSYNSALVAREMCLSENPDRKIHVFDSKSAGPGETQLYLKLKELIKDGLSFEHMVEKMEHFIDEVKTFLILENFDNLVKNGRMSRHKGFLGSVLHFSPIMMGRDGVIELYENIRGKKKSLKRLAEVVVDVANKTYDEMGSRILTISHVNAKDSIDYFLKELGRLDIFKEIRIFESGDLTTTYADDGGIIVCL